MTDLYLDPWVLTHSPSARQSFDPERYVRALLAVHSLLEDKTLSASVSANAAGLLVTDECYPCGDVMPDCLWPHRRDVFRLVNSILDKLPRVEEDDGVVAILAEKCCWVPAVLPQEVSLAAAAHRDELALRSVVHTRKDHAGYGPALLSRVEPAKAYTLQVSARLWEVERVDSAVTKDGEEIRGKVVVGQSPADIALEIDPLELWRDGRFGDSLTIAEFQASCTAKGASGAWPPSRGCWRFAPGFEASVRAMGCLGAGARPAAAYRACLDSLLHLNLAKVHPLRRDAGGGSQTRVRSADGAVGWRRDIDYEYHLHYWKVGEHIELSSVVPHHVFSIED